MSELGPDGDALLAAIASRALERNQERADRLVTLLAAGADPLADAVREDATTLAHQIAGSAGTFGYEAASALARTVMDGLAAGALPPRCVPPRCASSSSSPSARTRPRTTTPRPQERRDHHP
ncbi:Hpt domain-containing protein [Litorihabitans aurantiacus]|uniref:HPt domain-containing protein n=1 Tax=Litorihabitans aurantiacus TaxID=1930061 RepID=A0AA37UIY3_9MICO|nr:Hpt domain-containing protein [Litorihabitans aurantiacus]GMA30025.1 hypothetical protein GCM10025875_00170 [Litorihabitans aurantiacus]